MDEFERWLMDNTICSPCKTFYKMGDVIETEIYWFMYWCELVQERNKQSK